MPINELCEKMAPNTTSEKMKAVFLKGIDQDLSCEETQTPSPEGDEVLVKIRSAALNHRDIWIQKGKYPDIAPPCILGSDGCGVVVETGPDAPEELKDKEVVINPGIAWGSDERHQSRSFRVLGMPDPGTFSEYFCISAQYIYEKPPHLDSRHAAALPLGGLTAYRALFSRAKLQEGEKVLITGVGGGVAQIALQLALEAGAEVHVTSGADSKIRKAMELGAQSGVNYKEERWGEAIKKRTGGFDVILDSAGGRTFSQLVRIAKPGGRIAFYGGTNGNIQDLSPQIMFWKQLTLLGSTMGSDKDFKEMLAFAREKEITPEVDRVFSLDEPQKALDHLNSGEQFGKVVLDVTS